MWSNFPQKKIKSHREITVSFKYKNLVFNISSSHFEVKKLSFVAYTKSLSLTMHKFAKVNKCNLIIYHMQGCPKIIYR